MNSSSKGIMRKYGIVIENSIFRYADKFSYLSKTSAVWELPICAI